MSQLLGGVERRAAEGEAVDLRAARRTDERAFDK
jgi:hypothetical protein